VMDRLQMQREYESRLQAMRDRCGPRIDARASVQENVAASLHEARRKKEMKLVEGRASGAGGMVEESDKLKSLQDVKYTGNVKEYVVEMQKEAANHGRHWLIYRRQHRSYQRMWEEETMVLGMLYIIIDFAMNYSHDHLTETLSEFFAKYQTTLLPVVVWFLAPTVSDGRVEVQRHSRVYISEDRRHSNNFVQKVLDDLLAHFKGIMGKEAAGVGECMMECMMRRLCVWSDGCGGQFKNKWQMRGVEPLTMMFFLKAFSPRVLRRDRTDEQKFSKSSSLGCFSAFCCFLPAPSHR